MLFYFAGGDAGFWLIAFLIVIVGGFVLLLSVITGGMSSRSNDEKVNPLTSALHDKRDTESK